MPEPAPAPAPDPLAGGMVRPLLILGGIMVVIVVFVLMFLIH
jgi:hypothetical protein